MTDPTFLSIDEVLEIHHSMIENYGGSLGIRDEGLLLSALEVPRSGFGGKYFHETIFDMAAAYLFHFVKNHPFVDGNKRIGLGCADLFLYMNDYELNLSSEEAERLTMKVASESSSKEEIAAVFKKNSKPFTL
ncbi:MAG: type II toxin-antitoxin system death-on-curing family toxin [Chloroflexota bacterium]